MAIFSLSPPPSPSFSFSLCCFSKPIFECISLLISRKEQKQSKELKDPEELFHARQVLILFLTAHNCGIFCFIVTNYFRYLCGFFYKAIA